MALCFFTWIINIAFPTIAPAAGPGLTSWSSWQSFYGACLKSFLGANLRSDFMLDAINSCVRMNLAGFLKLGLSWKESTLSDIPLQVRLFPWHSHCLRLDWASHRVFAGLEWRAPSSWWNFKKTRLHSREVVQLWLSRPQLPCSWGNAVAFRVPAHGCVNQG